MFFSESHNAAEFHRRLMEGSRKGASSDSIVREQCSCFKNRDWSCKDLREGDQMSESEKQKCIGAMEEILHKSGA